MELLITSFEIKDLPIKGSKIDPELIIIPLVASQILILPLFVV